MAEKRYLAHRAEDGREQSILEHLHRTAAMSSEFAAAFGAGPQGELAGLAHDIGKYSEAFQRRLDGSADRVDHSTAGAVECIKLGQVTAAFAVAGHHGGLPDGGAQGDNREKSSFHGRMRRAAEGKLEPCEAWREELSLPSPPQPSIDPRDSAEGMFFTRMLYSCLVDADYLDTEEFMSKGGVQRPVGEPIEKLEKKLLNYISGWFPPTTALNENRCAILRQCLEQGESCAPGLFTLTVPTGGGKTVASLAFALSHARAKGLKRVIYVVPYTSIIEQNAGVFRKILGEQNVLEHHSGVQYDPEGESTPQTVLMSKATENWDVPLVVTTAVQFFESLFSNRPSQCRKLHNLAGSVIIFDEAQMLPIPYLRPCVYAISQLVAHYKVSAVLCTATQPALDKLFREFIPGQGIKELCPPELRSEEVFRRVSFRRAGTLSLEELAGEISAQEQALCIVNSRKTAHELYRLLPSEGSYHLSTLMYPAHRKAVLKEIRERLDGGLSCRVVSTSLIEAGVDVDFPAVYREMAGLDSLLQAAGRCNREGKRAAAQSVVSIFKSEGPTPQLFSIPVEAGEETLSAFEDPGSSEAMAFYFRNLLVLKGTQAQDKNHILPMMKDGSMCFREVARQFKLIDSPARTVYVPLGAGAELVSELRTGMRDRELFRKLGQYGVTVYQQHFKALYYAGAVELLDGDIAVLNDVSLYSRERGLSLELDQGQGYFI